MPKIGLRMVKSAIAVGLCFLIYMIRGTGIPFYSAIAAVLCMQPEMEDSWSKGKSRCIGTLLGGIAGLLALMFFQQYIPMEKDWLRYICISILIIPLIYSTIVLKQPSSSYLSCVVFMSITISHIGDESPATFAMYRMLDTFIGIFVALAVNAFHIPHKKHKDVLIEIPLAHIMHNNRIDTRTFVHINACIDAGAKLLFTTRHAPSITLSILDHIHTPAKCLCLDGVLLYDVKESTCVALYTMEAPLWHQIMQVLKRFDVTPFVYEIRDELLYVHYQQFHNEAMEEYYKTYYKRNHQRYIYHEKQMDMKYDILALMMLITSEQYEEILSKLKDFDDKLTCISYPYSQQYCMLKICPAALGNVDISEQIAKTMKLKEVVKIRKYNEDERVEAQIKKIEYAFHKGKAKGE